MEGCAEPLEVGRIPKQPGAGSFRRPPAGLEALDLLIGTAGLFRLPRFVRGHEDGVVAAGIVRQAGSAEAPVRDAFNLAWKRALVSKGDATGTLIESFSPERSFIGKQVLGTAERLTSIGTPENPLLRVLGNTIAHFAFGIPGVEHTFAQKMTELSVGYPESPLNAGSARDLDGPSPAKGSCPAAVPASS